MARPKLTGYFWHQTIDCFQIVQEEYRIPTPLLISKFWLQAPTIWARWFPMKGRQFLRHELTVLSSLPTWGLKLSFYFFQTVSIFSIQFRMGRESQDCGGNTTTNNFYNRTQIIFLISQAKVKVLQLGRVNFEFVLDLLLWLSYFATFVIIGIHNDLPQGALPSPLCLTPGLGYLCLAQRENSLTLLTCEGL